MLNRDDITGTPVHDARIAATCVENARRADAEASALLREPGRLPGRGSAIRYAAYRPA